MSLSALKSIIRSETTSNSHIYNYVYRGSSTTQLFAEMELYVNNRIFETLFGDLVPLVVANALSSNVIIINKQVNGGHNMHTVPPSTSAQISGNIMVYKTGKHYDACLPKSSARAESVEISPLKYVPLAENISDKAGVKPGRDQSNQHRSISVPYSRCDISNDDHDISTDLPRNTFLHFLCIHSYLNGRICEQGNRDINISNTMSLNGNGFSRSWICSMSNTQKNWQWITWISMG